MRHRVDKTIFGRDTNHRKALLRNGVRGLVEHGEITTTRAKAKEFQRLADKMIHTAQTGTVAARRQLHRFFGKRDVVNTLVDRIAPLFTDRSSGFTRISTQGKRRGDNVELFKLELVNKPTELGKLSNPNPRPVAEKKTVSKTVKVVKKAASAEKKPAKKVAATTQSKAKPKAKVAKTKTMAPKKVAAKVKKA